MPETNLYPLIFKPSFHYRIWGGNQLKRFHPEINQDKIGESWEISTVPNFVSEITNGHLQGKNLNDAIQIYKENLLGKETFRKYGLDFPLLIKFLDAQEVLSVQVHPNDEYAQKHYHSFGKSEMWYVLDAQENSELIIGLKENVDKEKYLEAVEKDRVEDVLRRVKVKKGDVFYIPAGRIHAIGKGIMIAEIQQTSDITFRIYDYNRVDKDGKKRELHVKEAAEVIDFTYIKDPFSHYKNYEKRHEGKEDKSENRFHLVESPYFTSNKITFNKPLTFTKEDKFRIYICIEGNFTIKYKEMSIPILCGHSFLIPACLDEFTFIPSEESVLLETYT